MKIYNLFTIQYYLLSFYTSAFPLPERTVSDEFDYQFINSSDDFPEIHYQISKTITTLTTDVSILSNLTAEQPTQQVMSSTLLIMSFVVAAFSVLINFRVFCIVFINSKRKSRPANILVAHLSSVVIVFAILTQTYLLEKSEVYTFSAPGLCNVLNLLRTGIYNVIPVNAGAITLVRTKKDAMKLRSSYAYQLIKLMWAVTLLCNLPTIWMTEYGINHKTKLGECRQLNLLGSLEATIAFDVVRFLLFTVLVSLYLIQATIKVQSTLKYLQIPQLARSERTVRRIQQTRFVKWHSITFIITWLPLEIMVFLNKTLNRNDFQISSAYFLAPALVLYSAMIILCPLSFIFLLEEMSAVDVFLPFCRSKNNPALPVNLTNVGQTDQELFDLRVCPRLNFKAKVPTKQKPDSLTNKNGNKVNVIVTSFMVDEMSRISTAGVSITSDCVKNTVPRIIITEPSSSGAQCSSIPSLLTPSTSARLENIAVELHPEPEQINAENEMESFQRNCETLI